jgi:hypothetical protein
MISRCRRDWSLRGSGRQCVRRTGAAWPSTLNSWARDRAGVLTSVGVSNEKCVCSTHGVRIGDTHFAAPQCLTYDDPEFVVATTAEVNRPLTSRYHRSVTRRLSVTDHSTGDRYGYPDHSLAVFDPAGSGGCS